MSQNIILTGNLDMLHSLYDFTATYAKTLSFRPNEYFLLQQTNTKHKHWWEVINEAGEVGFIPSNYVETVTVNPSFYLHFLNTCLENLKRKSNSEVSIVSDRNTVIERLEEMKKEIEALPEVNTEENSPKREISMPPLSLRNSDESRSGLSGLNTSSTSESSLITGLRTCRVGSGDEDTTLNFIKPAQRSLEDIPQEVVLSAETKNKGADETVSITHQSVFDLVENVRVNTQLSHEMSRVAVVTVVQGLHELLPASVFPYLSTIMSQVQSLLVVDDVNIDQTHDASRLKIIFNELTSCKEDSQQRSWMLHEDEDVIKDYLQELISILSNADTSISRHVISSDQYHCVVTLIQFYQMEVRWSIRQLLLQTFGVLCSLDKTVVNIMLTSILPGELARDMMASPRNIAKLNYSSILLTMIFSMGEPMPITHNDLVGVSFLSFLLDNIEYPPDTDIDEQIPDLFLNCVISFNLQFRDCDENFVLNALEARDVAKTFTEKILLLLNREHDPVRIFDHEPAPPHSVLKLFIDLLNRKTTADLFYTNDIKVLIDIVVRNIADLSPGDKRRAQYIELCRRVMRNTNYEDHRHRLDDILKCFTRIFCEENELSKNDQKLVREISHEFPLFFQ